MPTVAIIRLDGSGTELMKDVEEQDRAGVAAGTVLVERVIRRERQGQGRL